MSRLGALVGIPYLRSLRWRALALALVSLLLPPLIVFGWLVVERGYQSGMQSNAAFTAQEARRLIEQEADAADACTAAQRQRAALDDLAQLHRVSLVVLDGAGRACLARDADGYVDLSQRAGSVVLAQPTAGAARTPRIEQPPARLREHAECSEVDGQHRCSAMVGVRAGYVLVEDGARRPLSVLSVLSLPLIRLSLFSSPVVIGFAWWLSRRLARPFEELRESVLRKVDAADAAPDLEALGSGEVEDLSQSFNALLTSLEQRRERELGHAADLVHELKNPLASVRAVAEALQKPDMDPERRMRLGQVLEQSAARLTRHAEEFLELNRAEADFPDEARSSVPLARLARGVVDGFQRDERFVGVTFSVDGESDLRVRGVAPRLETVLRNLVENAALFAAPNGRVEVRLTRDEEHAVVAVRDDGPGIAPDDLPRLFDRFFSRRRGGTGLGLALSEAIVRTHGGTLRAANVEPHGAEFRVELPAAPHHERRAS